MCCFSHDDSTGYVQTSHVDSSHVASLHSLYTKLFWMWISTLTCSMCPEGSWGDLLQLQSRIPWIMVNDILDWRFALLKTLFCSTPSFMSQLLSDIVPSSVWYLRLLTVSLHTVKRFQAHSKNHLFNEYYREYHNLFEKKHQCFNQLVQSVNPSNCTMSVLLYS